MRNIGPGGLHAAHVGLIQAYLAIVDTYFLYFSRSSFFLSFCALLFTRFGGTQEADFVKKILQPAFGCGRLDQPY